MLIVCQALPMSTNCLILWSNRTTPNSGRGARVVPRDMTPETLCPRSGANNTLHLSSASCEHQLLYISCVTMITLLGELTTYLYDFHCILGRLLRRCVQVSMLPVLQCSPIVESADQPRKRTFHRFRWEGGSALG